MMFPVRAQKLHEYFYLKDKRSPPCFVTGVESELIPSFDLQICST